MCALSVNIGDWSPSTQTATYGIIGDITGDFINNSNKNLGGAIWNSGGKIGVIKGDFRNNLTESFGGGAIANNGRIDGIEGNFIDNKLTSALYGGGAIYNGYGSASDIGYIIGDFVGNSTESNYSNTDHTTYNIHLHAGGAISNDNGSKIGYIKGNFYDNHATGVGGVIANIGSGYDRPYNESGRITIYSTIGDIEGDFYNNTAEASGGAICNNSKIGDISGDFYGNTSKIYGGAIANLPQGTSSNPTAGTGINYRQFYK